jgi:Ser/Thr protein kinase RdoA (MazF antagonist)
VAGYRCHRQLSEQQVSYLLLFLMARGLTYLGWVHTRPETQAAKEMTPMLIAGAAKTWFILPVHNKEKLCLTCPATILYTRSKPQVLMSFVVSSSSA